MTRYDFDIPWTTIYLRICESKLVASNPDEADSSDWHEEEDESVPMAGKVGDAGSLDGSESEGPLLTFEDFARIARGTDSTSADAEAFGRYVGFPR
jgi:hypothetical protein